MRNFLPVVIAAALLSGCGAAGTGPDMSGLFAKGDKATAVRGMKAQKAGGPGLAGPIGGPGLAWPGVVLSEEQQAQMKALMQKYAPAKPAEGDREAQQAKREALDAALMAGTFDAAAFKAALEALQPAEPQADDDQLQVEARAILTDAQRAAAIAVLKALPEPKAPAERPAPAAKPAHADPLVKSLGLTDDQAAKLTALRDAAKPAAPAAHDPAADRAAQIAFLETGDPANLPAKPARKALPIDAIVDFVASLDGPQRGKLAAAGLPFAGGGKPGFGGPGGFAGKRGPGGEHGGFGRGGEMKGGFAKRGGPRPEGPPVPAEAGATVAAE